jgi:transposase
MGAQSAKAALTESGGGAASVGSQLFVGVDVGRHQHQVAAITRTRMEDGSWERGPVRGFAANAMGFRELVAWLEAWGLPPEQVRVGCEPTGGWYSRTVVAWLETYGYQIDWLQNWAVHERRQLVLGKQTKTDALDARLIARLLYEQERLGHSRAFLHPTPPGTESLRMLVRNRLKLVNFRTRYRLQLGAVQDVLFPEFKQFFRASSTGRTARLVLERFPTPAELAAATLEQLQAVVVGEARAHTLRPRLPELQRLAAGSAGLTGDEHLPRIQAWLLRQLQMLEEEIAVTERTLLEALAAWPDQRSLEILHSFPHMSELRAAVLLSAIGDVKAFHGDRQLRKHLGWYPEAAESGTSVRRHRLGEKGNRLARREVWLWVLSLIKADCQIGTFRAYYLRLRERGVGGKVAVGHVASKLISVLFFCLRHGEPYDPERHARELGFGEALERSEVRPLPMLRPAESPLPPGHADASA